MLKHPNQGIILMGDFNQYPSSSIQSSYNLRQIVKGSTFMSKTLDKILTNMGQLYAVPLILPPLGSLDRGHNVVTCTPALPCRNGTQKEVTFKVTKRDQHPQRQIALGQAVMHYPWHNIYAMDSCKDKFDFFQSSMEEMINFHMPYKTVVRSHNDPPWVTDTFKALVQSRKKAWNEKLPTYRGLKTKVRRMARSLKRNFYLNAMADMSQSKQSNWWSITKKLLGKSKDNSRAFQNIADASCGGDLDKLCNKVNDFYVSIANDLTPLSPQESEPMDVPANFIISVKSVEERLMKLNVKKAQGPDGIPNWLLRDMAPILAGPICNIFNTSLSQSVIPQLWKSANITNIPKCNPPNDITSDLRPISLLPVLSKLHENLIGHHIWSFVAPHINDDQYGGMKNSNTIMALIDMLNNWHNAAHHKKLTRVLLIDYQKAFDHVCHNLIIEKLIKYGVPDILTKWAREFLTSRQQRVTIGQHTSGWRSVRGGVPQGSWLGPVLFVTAINDLQLPGCTLHKYMDDTTITESIGANEISKMPSFLQQVMDWSRHNKMNLNPKKTKELIISFATSTKLPDTLMVDNSQIRRVDSCKLLGMCIQSNLKWDTHINELISKASMRLYFLCSLRRAGVKPDKLQQYYVACIRSMIEYGAVLYHAGLTKKQSSELEAIQTRAEHIIYGRVEPPTSAMESLSDRRTNACIKLFNQMVSPSHRLHHLLPPRHLSQYNLRRQRQFAPSNIMTTKRYNAEFVNYCVTNFNTAK